MAKYKQVMLTLDRLVVKELKELGFNISGLVRNFLRNKLAVEKNGH